MVSMFYQTGQVVAFCWIRQDRKRHPVVFRLRWRVPDPVRELRNRWTVPRPELIPDGCLPVGRGGRVPSCIVPAPRR